MGWSGTGVTRSAGWTAAARRSAKSVSIQRVWTAKSSVNSGASSTARWKGRTDATPSMRNSRSARRARAMAVARSGPVTISLAIIESNWPATWPPCSTPLSSRMPMPPGADHSVIGPGVGRKPRPGSSALMRNSIAWPMGSGTPSSVRRAPCATRIIARTMSMPVVSSVTGCSTCRRVFTSRKLIVPLADSRNSTVPAPL